MSQHRKFNCPVPLVKLALPPKNVKVDKLPKSVLYIDENLNLDISPLAKENPSDKYDSESINSILDICSNKIKSNPSHEKARYIKASIHLTMEQLNEVI